MNRIHMATYGPITLKENGIEYLYASLDKYPDVCSVVTCLMLDQKLKWQERLS
jgi:hypothetical protein